MTTGLETTLSPDEVLATTRSVRIGIDTSREVPRELIEECVTLALQAPSGSNIQNAHFVVVTDAEKRRALAEIYRRGWEVYAQTPVYAPNLKFDDPEHGARHEKIVKDALAFVEHIQDVPVMVIPCVEFGAGRGKVFAEGGYSREAALPALLHSAIWGAILPAATRFRLAARARGLGSCWTVVHLFFEQDAAEVLGIPYENVQQAALFPVGYASDDEFFRAWRPPLSEVLHWDSW